MRYGSRDVTAAERFATTPSRGALSAQPTNTAAIADSKGHSTGLATSNTSSRHNSRERKSGCDTGHSPPSAVGSRSGPWAAVRLQSPSVVTAATPPRGRSRRPRLAPAPLLLPRKRRSPTRGEYPDRVGPEGAVCGHDVLGVKEWSGSSFVVREVAGGSLPCFRRAPLLSGMLAGVPWPARREPKGSGDARVGGAPIVSVFRRSGPLAYAVASITDSPG